MRVRARTNECRSDADCSDRGSSWMQMQMQMPIAHRGPGPDPSVSPLERGPEERLVFENGLDCGEWLRFG